MPNLKLRRLRAVIGVYEHGSALKATEFVHLSQPAIMDAIGACEDDLGALLFTRTSRGMTPTDAGTVLCTRIASAFGYLRQADDEISMKRGKATRRLHRLISEVQLRALSAIISSGGFHAAARQLGLSQPSVYRAARELETLCGVPLLQRNGAGILPTAEALDLARLGDLCFRELSHGLDEIRELQGIMDGSLNIGALPLARSKWLPDSLASVLRKYPFAKVRIMDGPYAEQLSALRHGRIDMIMGALRDPPPIADIVQEHIFNDPFVIVVRAAHPLAAGFDSEQDKLPPRHLGELAWVLPRQGTPGRANFEAFMAAKGLTSPASVVECSSFVTTRSLVMQSDYAALLSRQQVEAEVALDQLKIMGPPLTASSRAIGITTRKGFRPTGLQRAFLDQIHQYGKPI